MLKHSFQKPPKELYKRCHLVFHVNWNDGICITYGDTAYSINPIFADLDVHESVHMRQQLEMGPDIWWEKYFLDKEFRLSQEVEAYRAQIAFIREHYRRERRRELEERLPKDMARMYGGMISVEKAKELIL